MIPSNPTELPSSGLSGQGLLQSRQEWDRRNEVLADSLAGYVESYLGDAGERALDVGCQAGALTDAWARRIHMRWTGIDPSLSEPTSSPAGVELMPGMAHRLPFPERHFDCLMFANVYEHLLPALRLPSLIEMYRVLRPGGVLVGQLPNPYFPIESHSRLPFLGWLPERMQRVYWRLAPVPWEHDFFVVTIKDLMADTRRAGYEEMAVRNFNYPPDVIPARVRWAARLLQRPMRRFPWAWQFVLRRPWPEDDTRPEPGAVV